MKRIAILGSTGSIGRSTLEVIRRFPDKFRPIALSTNSNIAILEQQIRQFNPAFVCVQDRKAAQDLRSKLDLKKTKLLFSQDGLNEIAQSSLVDQVVVAISGSAALGPLLMAIDNCKKIALANKEALVMAGSLIMHRAAKKKIRIIPIDSEQSAIWQCLSGQDKNKLQTVYLTASGGPFRNSSIKSLKGIKIKSVLKHPRWKMGRKISVDSATLMNKGLEVLEAMFLFGLDLEKIKVVVHPEAIIHSMVEFIDGVIMAQLSITDMRIPIQYALSYPQRLDSGLRNIDFYKLKVLTFEKPDLKKFPCLELAYQVAREGGTAPAALNAANEVSVGEFLKGRLSFLGIPKVISKVLSRHRNIKKPNLPDILNIDIWAKAEAGRVIANLR
ncbi:1-deoxy-D-xylulose-5-phosphate reductoisomerase [bacterium]|nr:MAG: 1-deoxy-D-xylulose-5-phosphate reductoisomerase [bacterium]